MAISVTTPSPGKAGWIINATSADASGCEELKAAPAELERFVFSRKDGSNDFHAMGLTDLPG